MGILEIGITYGWIYASSAQDLLGPHRMLGGVPIGDLGLRVVVEYRPGAFSWLYDMCTYSALSTWAEELIVWFCHAAELDKGETDVDIVNYSTDTVRVILLRRIHHSVLLQTRHPPRPPLHELQNPHSPFGSCRTRNIYFGPS